jgi:hypothetical protein
MSIEVPVLEVLDLAGRLRAAAEPGHSARARLEGAEAELTGGIAAALDDTLQAFRMASAALAVETEELGDAVDATARSWLAMDAGLLGRRGQVAAR